VSRPYLRGVAVAAALVGVLVSGCTGSDASGAAPDPPKRNTDIDPTQPASSYVVPPCPRLPHQAVVKGGLPDLTLPCLGGGRRVRLADLRGTPTVLSIWAAWCEPCAEEMPVLADGMRRAGDRVRFFGVHYKAPEKYGERSAADFGVAFPSAQDTDGDRTALALRATAPPQTLFYAADGTLAGRHAGAITSAKQLDQLVEQYLGVRL
jgi:cytochrome c biogenesis protein CcmG/thiol:disulfide interchange protein DsbE